MNRIQRQMRVRNTKTGSLGVTVDDLAGLLSCCDPGETPVVFDGQGGFTGIQTEDLEVLGPENAIADLQRCGAGKGADCCIFLASGPEGVSCQRFGELRYDIIFRKEKMNAKREPTEPFPGCQLF